MWVFDGYLGAWVVISLVFPRAVMKPLLQRAVPATPGKALKSRALASGAAVPCRTTLCPPLRLTPAPHQWRLCTADLFMWEAKSSREFPPLALTETTNISLPMWQAARDSQTCCSLDHAQESISLVALSLINQLFFSLSPAFLVIKVLRAGAAPKNWLPSPRVLHPSLLPNLLVSSASPWAGDI